MQGVVKGVQELNDGVNEEFLKAKQEIEMQKKTQKTRKGRNDWKTSRRKRD
jgi:hypothetical protein